MNGATADETKTTAGRSQSQSQQPIPDVRTENMVNLTLLDPPRWGWTAAGGVADLLSPHEVRFPFFLFLLVSFILVKS